MTYEYKVIPAPTRGLKAKGLKTPADRFANALGAVMNEMAAEGWDYLRTDTLPSEQRQGLTGRTTVFQNMLVFRRAAEVAVAGDAADVTAEADAPKVDVEAPARDGSPKLPGAAKDNEPSGLRLPRIGNPLRADREKDVAAE